LKLIDTNAFNTTNLVTKKFSVNCDDWKPVSHFIPLTNFPPTHDIFHMLSSIISLQELELCYTNITQIPSNAFQPKNGAQNNLTFITVLLSLFLQWTKLNGTSFELGSLNNLKRPTDLYLGDNPKQTYLDEHIFRPFLKENDQNVIRIDIYDVSYFDCNDCRSYWLKKESKYYNRTNL
jgi:hypothetical protein